MLLDTVVSQLEQAKGESSASATAAAADKQDKPVIRSHSSSSGSSGSTQQNSITAILKMLNEVLRISSAKGENENSFLQPGSAKVTGCIKLLTQLITSKTETPAVVRQAIKCAKLLSKQIGQADATTFSTDVLKAIGEKIKVH